MILETSWRNAVRLGPEQVSIVVIACNVTKGAAIMEMTEISLAFHFQHLWSMFYALVICLFFTRDISHHYP